MRFTEGSQRRPTLRQALFAGAVFLALMVVLAGCGSSAVTASVGATTAALSGNPTSQTAKVEVSGARLSARHGAGSLNVTLHNPTAKTLELVAVTSPAASTAMFMSGTQMSSQPMKIPRHATLRLNGSTGSSGSYFVMLSGVPTTLKPGAKTHVTLTFEINSTTTSSLTFPVTVKS